MKKNATEQEKLKTVVEIVSKDSMEQLFTTYLDTIEPDSDGNAYLNRGSLAVSPCTKWKQPKWKFSTFCGLPGTTSYPYLPLRTIDPPDTRSHPQGGVQIYPQPNYLHKKGIKKYPPPNSDFS